MYDFENNKLKASHNQLQAIANFFSNDKRDFIEHEGWFCKVSDEYDMILGAFVHRTNRGQAAGGVRYWSYDTIEDYFRDGLRLATGMTFKNALAGLWWGGEKGVIAHNPKYNKRDTAIRKIVYLVGTLCGDLGITEWRQYRHIFKKIKIWLRFIYF